MSREAEAARLRSSDYRQSGFASLTDLTPFFLEVEGVVPHGAGDLRIAVDDGKAHLEWQEERIERGNWHRCA